ncbi:MAG: endolytic transglycosylase MltG [candidate division Zixibacteria bacterium]|nr:endolytic transglycosylase MltG [candidate division Zixibacteria bacterium]
MKDHETTGNTFKAYEYILYGLTTLALLILAIPVIVWKTAAFLVGSAGTPMKSVKHLLGFIALVIIIAVGFLAFKIFIPYEISDGVVSVMVDENDTFAKVTRALKMGGVVADDKLFSRLAVFRNIDKNLIPGRYDFSGRMSLYQILDKFKRHDIATLLLTVPEGYTAAKIAARLARQMEIDSATFHELAFDTAYTMDKYRLSSLEGYLFPETYKLWYGMKVPDIIDAMVAEYQRQTEGVFDTPAPNNLTKDEIMVLASIIEAEAYYTDEMPTISSVYHNRLRKGMRLQADPTVIYALGGLDRPLQYRDLKYQSSYNTYRNKGLPPGPINSPGLAAIKAAIKPADTDYLYFVANGTGRHTFTRTLKEHNVAKRDAKQKRRENQSN